MFIAIFVNLIRLCKVFGYNYSLQNDSFLSLIENCLLFHVIFALLYLAFSDFSTHATEQSEIRLIQRSYMMPAYH